MAKQSLACNVLCDGQKPLKGKGSMDARKVACYCRVSTGEQAEKGYSLEDQKRRTAAIAQLFFPDNEAIQIQDIGSGTSDKRQGFRRIMALAASGQIRAIIVVDLDRLCRSVGHFVSLLQHLRDRDVALYAQAQGFDMSSDLGEAVCTLLMTMAQFESRSISKRVKRAVESQRRERRKGSGTRPFGWRPDASGILQRDVDEQRAIDLAQGLRAKDRSWREVSEVLRDGGFKTVLGGPWTAESARGVITSAVARRGSGF